MHYGLDLKIVPTYIHYKHWMSHSYMNQEWEIESLSGELSSISSFENSLQLKTILFNCLSHWCRFNMKPYGIMQENNLIPQMAIRHFKEQSPLSKLFWAWCIQQWYHCSFWSNRKAFENILIMVMSRTNYTKERKKRKFNNLDIVKFSFLPFFCIVYSFIWFVLWSN